MVTLRTINQSKQLAINHILEQSTPVYTIGNPDLDLNDVHRTVKTYNEIWCTTETPLLLVPFYKSLGTTDSNAWLE